MKHDGYSFKSVECDKMKSTSIFNFVKDKLGTIYCHNLNHQIFKISGGKCELFFEIPEEGKGADIYLLTTNLNELIIVSKEAYVFSSTGKKITSSENINHGYLGFPFLLKDGTITCSESNMKRMLVYKNTVFSEKELIFKDPSILEKENSVLNFFHIGSKSYAINLLKRELYSFNEIDFSITKNSSKLIENQTEHLRYYSTGENFWLTSSVNGVVILDQNFENVLYSNKIYEDYYISHIYKDKEGNYLLSTFDKGILIIPNLKTLDVLKDLKGLNVVRITSDKDQNYIGTNDGQIVLLENGKKTTLSASGSKSIEAMYKWPNKPFVLTDNQGLTIINTQSKVQTILNEFSFKSATVLSSNSLYIATNRGVGILTLNEITGKFDFKFLTDLLGRSYSLFTDTFSKHLYVATSDGLKIKDPKGTISLLKIKNEVVFVTCMFYHSSKLYVYSKSHGLLIISKGKLLHQYFPIYKSETIKFYKFQIKGNRMFANTSLGFFILDLQGNVLYSLNKSNGLSANKVIDFNVTGNSIWVSHIRGVQILNLNKIEKGIRSPKLIISRIELNNHVIKLVKGNNNFGSQNNKLSFILQVPTLKNRDNIFYHYKLLPNDSTWIVNGYADNRITYNALAPGNYQFIVKAENNGVFSKPIIYYFTIQAPFYQRWWFIISVIIIIVSSIVLFYRRKLTKQKIESQQLNELNASKLTAIQSQMNPHFIFNSLNSIQDLVLKGDVTNSYTFITKFSNLVRRTLNYSDKDFIEFDQEIKLLELYLALEKLRFKESLEFIIDTNDIDDIKVPPMLIQPFIENSLLHGLLHKEGLKKISIIFKLEDTLVCEIIDNGIGREKAREIQKRQRSDHESFAIGAIKKRFDILGKHFKGELGFEYFDLMDGENSLGTKVVLRIPIKQMF